MSKDQSPKTGTQSTKTKIPINLVFGLRFLDFSLWSLGFRLRASGFGLWTLDIYGIKTKALFTWYSLLCSTICTICPVCLLPYMPFNTPMRPCGLGKEAILGNRQWLPKTRFGKFGKRTVPRYTSGGLFLARAFKGEEPFFFLWNADIETKVICSCFEYFSWLRTSPAWLGFTT